jgi:hypothetical protein
MMIAPGPARRKSLVRAGFDVKMGRYRGSADHELVKTNHIAAQIRSTAGHAALG